VARSSLSVFAFANRVKRIWHLPWLLCSLVGSILIIRLLDPFAGMGTGALVAFLFGAVAVSHLAAGIVGSLLLNRTWRRHTIVLSIAMLPALLFSLSKLREAYYLRYQAVYDRFRDELANPIPNSVRKLEFNPISEAINADLSFRFDIDPKDLRSIISSKELNPVRPDDLLCPQDYFKYPYYLPVRGEFVLYQGHDKDGDVLTLKVTEAHDHAVFRKESEAYYRYHYWDANPTLVKMGQEDLERLKRKWAGEQDGAPCLTTSVRLCLTPSNTSHCGRMTRCGMRPLGASCANGTRDITIPTSGLAAKGPIPICCNASHY